MAENTDYLPKDIEKLLANINHTNESIDNIAENNENTNEGNDKMTESNKNEFESKSESFKYAAEGRGNISESHENFRRLAEHHNLAPDTLDMLLREDYDDEDALCYMNDQQFESLTKSYEIGESQKRMLRKWLLEMKGKYYDEQQVNQCEAMKQLDIGATVTDQFQKDDACNILGEIDAVIGEVRTKVNIGITGQAGIGKSTLINTLRSLKATDDGAAKVGTVESTKELKAFSFPDNVNVLLWDMPGVNTPNFPKDEYINKVGLTHFDALMICSGVRFSELDLWLAKESQKSKISFYLVRTKIDQDIESARDDFDADPEETVDAVRKNLRLNLQEANLPSDSIYLVEAKFITGGQLKYDFPKLIEQLIHNAPQKNMSMLIKTVVSVSEGIINNKEKIIKDEIPTVADEIAEMTDVEQQKRRVRTYLQDLLRWFGIGKDSLIAFDLKVRDLDVQLHELIYKIQKAAEQPKYVTKTRQGTTTVKEELSWFNPRWLWSDGTKEVPTTYEYTEKVPAYDLTPAKQKVVNEAKLLLLDILLQCKMIAEKVLEARKKKAGL